MTQYLLGWDKPIVELAVNFLLRDVSGRPLDLSRVMVVVPTRQAGRRLRECLADAARERGTMVLSPAVVQPSHFLRPRGVVASRAECLAVLADVLLELDYAQYANLFPASAGANQSGDFRWRLETAELFLELRRELCEGGHTVATASAGLKANPDFLEAARWDELAALETAFLAGLSGAGLADPAQAQIKVATEPVLPEGIQRLVIIGVPDPVPLAVQAWERLDQQKTVPVDVCIHAPPEQSGRFDAWGRPARAHWTTCPLPLQDEYIHLVPKPPDQADTARQLLPAPFLGGPAGNGDQQASVSAVGRLALGVLDEEVMPHLEATLRAAGIPVSNPALKPVASHALYHLIPRISGARLPFCQGRQGRPLVASPPHDQSSHAFRPVELVAAETDQVEARQA
jgi:ATP-dependent helicase/nuclease subunit B